MPALVQVAIHPSQFPEKVRRDLLRCLRVRQIAPKFHYESYQQSQKWLALHEAYSPSRTEADCAAVYDRAFRAAVKALGSRAASLVGLGCGGGQKDARLLSLLANHDRAVSYVPCDVSVALVLTASQAARSAVPGIACHPLVFNLDDVEKSTDVLGTLDGAGKVRLLTFFGMIPNFEPGTILPKLAAFVRPSDFLLFSANLAPGPAYAAGVRRVLPGYDNALTRDWLLTFWHDLGVEAEDGTLRFSMEDSDAKVKRIAADFVFTRRRTLCVYGERFDFKKGAKVRLFFSYRYTPALITSLLTRHRLNVIGQWIPALGEEGVFLCRKKRA
ncbi:MAG TPA: L-histidine N(alpha)-methyltransferase [Candidatus Saccharimonadales bacterium]|nr:L-histidine N(alpha)-methyltransferase [Candidatus Saccharimonadales bacterium]